MMLNGGVAHTTISQCSVFRGWPQAADDPLNADLGLVATAESKAMVSSAGDLLIQAQDISQRRVLFRDWGRPFAAGHDVG